MINFTDSDDKQIYIFLTGNIVKVEVYKNKHSLVYYVNGKVDSLNEQNTKILLKGLKEYYHEQI